VGPWTIVSRTQTFLGEKRRNEEQNAGQRPGLLVGQIVQINLNLTINRLVATDPNSTINTTLFPMLYMSYNPNVITIQLIEFTL